GLDRVAVEVDGLQDDLQRLVAGDAVLLVTAGLAAQRDRLDSRGGRRAVTGAWTSGGGVGGWALTVEVGVGRFGALQLAAQHAEIVVAGAQFGLDTIAPGTAASGRGGRQARNKEEYGSPVHKRPHPR